LEAAALFSLSGDKTFPNSPTPFPIITSDESFEDLPLYLTQAKAGVQKILKRLDTVF
jgi:hypothetical protein